MLLTNTLLNAYPPVRSLLAEPFRDAEAAAGRLHPLAEAVCAGEAEAARDASEAYMADTARIMMAALPPLSGLTAAVDRSPPLTAATRKTQAPGP